MKIGITYPSMGGSGIIATELGIKMAERGHEVHFITQIYHLELESLCQTSLFIKLKLINTPYFNIRLMISL